MTDTNGWVTMELYKFGPRRQSRYVATLYARPGHSHFMRIARRWLIELGEPNTVTVQINRTKQMIRIAPSENGKGRKIYSSGKKNSWVNTISCGGFVEALGLDPTVHRVIRFDAEIAPTGELLLLVRKPENIGEEG